MKANKLKFAVFLLCCLLSFTMDAHSGTGFHITGVNGKLLKNIQSRLDELSLYKPLSDFSTPELEQNIVKAMQPYGFFTPDVRIRQKNNTYLNIRIKPGPQILITKLSITLRGEGRNASEMNHILKQIPIKKGDPLNSVKYEKTKQLLLNAADQSGYLHATYEKANIIIDNVHETASIVLVLDTGQQFYFGQVQFDPTYISPELLSRYVPFHYGQPYAANKILVLSDLLNGSGYFKSVSVKAEDQGERYIPVKIHTEPVSQLNYSIGLGYGTDTGVRGRGGLYVVPVNHWGHKFNTLAMGSFNENTIQSQYIIPGQQPRVDQYEITGGLAHLNYDTGYSNSLLLSLSQRHSIPTFQRVLSINHLLERFDYSDQAKISNASLFPKASFTWFGKTDQLFSPNGYTVNVNGFFANKILLSDVNFSQTSLDAKAAFTLKKLRTRFYVHSIYGASMIDNINQFPLSLALLLGGSGDLKGYEYKSIGPGKKLVYGGFELQKETWKNWYLLGFIDTGDVYDPSLRSLKRDIGTGVMWVSPVGPVKIGLALPVDNHFHRSPHKNPRIVINIGPDL